MRSRPWVIAHRGASTVAADNSLEAFAKAIELGSDMIEFDVRRTKDDVLIAFHDEGIGGRRVGDYSEDELRAATGTAPVRLDAILDLAKDRVGLDVELKENGYVDRAMSVVREHFDPEQIVVTSFVDDVVAQVKRADPAIRTGLLVGRDRPKPFLRTRLRELFPVGRARACGADYLAPHCKLADLGVLGRAHGAGLPCLVWTVNDPERIKKYLGDPRVAGVITDVPDRALALRDAAEEAGR